MTVSTFAAAEIIVNVENNSRTYDLTVTNKDFQVSTYNPDPTDVISASSSDTFKVYSNYPKAIRSVDLEYSYDEGNGPTCYFRYVIMKDRYGNMLPQTIVADAKNSKSRDRADCSGSIDGFEASGDSVITLSVNRIKY